VYQNRALMFKN